MYSGGGAEGSGHYRLNLFKQLHESYDPGCRRQEYISLLYLVSQAKTESRAGL